MSLVSTARIRLYSVGTARRHTRSTLIAHAVCHSCVPRSTEKRAGASRRPSRLWAQSPGPGEHERSCAQHGPPFAPSISLRAHRPDGRAANRRQAKAMGDAASAVRPLRLATTCHSACRSRFYRPSAAAATQLRREQPRLQRGPRCSDGRWPGFARTTLCRSRSRPRLPAAATSSEAARLAKVAKTVRLAHGAERAGLSRFER